MREPLGRKLGVAGLAVLVAGIGLVTSVPMSVGSQTAAAQRPTVVGSTQPAAAGHPRGLIPHVSRGQKLSPKVPGNLLSNNPICSTCNPPLLFTRGDQHPVIGGMSGTPGHVTITPVYWAPAGYLYTPTYKTIINGYVQNVALASQQNTNVFSMSTEYYQQATASGAPIKHIQYVVQAGTALDDSSAFPSQGGATGCTADATYTACVTDVGLQTELQAFLSGLSRPIDDSHLYMVLFPQNVETCIQPGTASTTVQCSTNTYCAYHSSTVVATNGLIYGNEPFPVLGPCSDPWGETQAPNGDSFADAELSSFSHEANESITDWALAWFDASGFENGDQCAYTYGAPLGSTGVATDGSATGTAYNQEIGTGKYYTQDEFSNEEFALGNGDPVTPAFQFFFGTVAGCLQRDELPTASFTSPTTATAGAAVPFDGSASSDPDNATGLTYSWNWGDGTANGTGATPSHMFPSAGADTVTLTVTDLNGWSGTVSHVVTVTGTTQWAVTYGEGGTPPSWLGGETKSYSVSITNTGGQTWSAVGSNPVHLGVHFANAGGGAGSNTWYTDQRFSLPADLAPSASVTLSITVTAPTNLGSLVLEYQMVKEAQFWFSQFADVSVTIGPPLWAASYSLSGTPPSWLGGQTKSYSVTITNTGSQTWSAVGSNPVHLGVHFANAGGGAGTNTWYSDQRFSLPADLAPSASVTLSITVTAPTNLGSLVLEYQMVKEAQFWFSQFADVSVTIGPPLWAASYSVSGTPPSWLGGQTKSYSVTITNTGSQTWSAVGSNPVHLGVHFANAGGGAGTNTWYSDQRFSLPADLAPSASVTLSITVTAPAKLGSLVLEYQMVKEAQFWFSQFADVSVTVA